MIWFPILWGAALLTALVVRAQHEVVYWSIWNLGFSSFFFFCVSQGMRFTSMLMLVFVVVGHAGIVLHFWLREKEPQGQETL